MRIGPRTLLALAILAFGSCWGCGPAGGETRTALIPAKGTVTYKGQPVSKGVVTFTPDGYGRPAEGPLQPDGTFVLSTHQPGDGVVPGHHRVTVTETGIKSPRDALAKKWASEAASGLTADVDAEHTEFTFELK